jgi:hypothetical protein
MNMGAEFSQLVLRNAIADLIKVILIYITSNNRCVPYLLHSIHELDKRCI